MKSAGGSLTHCTKEAGCHSPHCTCSHRQCVRPASTAAESSATRVARLDQPRRATADPIETQPAIHPASRHAAGPSGSSKAAASLVQLLLPLIVPLFAAGWLEVRDGWAAAAAGGRARGLQRRMAQWSSARDSGTQPAAPVPHEHTTRTANRAAHRLHESMRNK